jgi:hypothetical protein
MAHMITVTIADDPSSGPVIETPIAINADQIVAIADVAPGQVGASRISMLDKTFHFVKETRAALVTLINA